MAFEFDIESLGLEIPGLTAGFEAGFEDYDIYRTVETEIQEETYVPEEIQQLITTLQFIIILEVLVIGVLFLRK